MGTDQYLQVNSDSNREITFDATFQPANTNTRVSEQ